MRHEEALLFLQHAKQVWVRISPLGSNPHWGVGRLFGVDGRCGIVQPANGHKHEERIPLENLQLWQSRHPELASLAVETEAAQQAAALQEASSAAISEAAAAPEVAAAPPVLADAPIIAEGSAPAAVVMQRALPRNILEQAQAILQMQQELQGQAQTRLQELEQENAELLAMIDANQQEAVELRKMLNLGQPQQHQHHTSIISEGMKARDQQCADSILKVLRENPHRWLSRNQIQELTGSTYYRFNWALRQLKQDQQITMMGNTNAATYKIANPMPVST